MSIELFCCESCAMRAKKTNKDFEIMNKISFPHDDIPECDLCGEKDAVLRCYDHPSDDD